MIQRNSKPGWTPDASQLQVINAPAGCHLVLAPPGCGKTQILTERIRKAHEEGVAYEDMLCLTFTNRAARSMKDRITQAISDPEVERLYVGNVHRFCSKFLFEQGIVSAETSIIDDDDAVSILARYLNEDELKVKGDYKRKSVYQQIMFFSHLMSQIEHGHAKGLRMHPESLTSEDVAALRYICKVEGVAFTREKLLDVYGHVDYYRDATRMDGYQAGMRRSIDNLLYKMRYAHAYVAYKRQNRLVDFEDLLLFTYDWLRSNAHVTYKWMQVDEVQDLNALQLALIDLLTGVGEGEAGTLPDGTHLMYLGDYQQAIFSFMGARQGMLDVLARRCAGNIHHLGVNHRAPSYLLDVYNMYAERQLGIDPRLLPVPDNVVAKTGGELTLLACDTEVAEQREVALLARDLYQRYPGETTAVIVTSNRDADTLSGTLTQLALPHFKVSGVDLFSTPDMKLLLAHFNVLDNDLNFMAWSRLLRGVRACSSYAVARDLVRRLLARAMTPADFLHDAPTYVQRFAAEYAEREMVIFDTETTGLDVTRDDILQIAAVKVKGGVVVPGSQFSVYMETDRPIPEMLGDIVNPIIEERKHQRLVSPREGLRAFLDYSRGCVLLGHNAGYDYHIMAFNVARYLPGEDWAAAHPSYLDSLKLARLLVPGLGSYKLKHLLEVLHLEGENSHLADADVEATRNLAGYLYRKAVEIIPRQNAFIREPLRQTQLKKLRDQYAALYRQWEGRMYIVRPEGCHPGPLLSDALRQVHDSMVEAGWIGRIGKLDHFLRFLDRDLIGEQAEPTLAQQMGAHLVEISTLKEADLCGSATVDDRIFVTTVHKAKGLEFDHVIVYDACDGRYPNYFNKGQSDRESEDARLFYVAISRARKRLTIAYSKSRTTWNGVRQPRQLTPFMDSIKRFFETRA